MPIQSVENDQGTLRAVDEIGNRRHGSSENVFNGKLGASRVSIFDFALTEALLAFRVQDAAVRLPGMLINGEKIAPHVLEDLQIGADGGIDQRADRR